MRLAVIGDVGVTDAMMHIGDEAMFETMVARFLERGASITGISAEPTETADRYGIDAVERIGFDMTQGRDAAEARLAAVIEAARTGDTSTTSDALAAEDPAWGVIDAVRAADGVAVAGGGNMASNWPMHIFERRALAGIAWVLDKPFIVSGQTLGPELVPADRELIAEIARIARRVGVREVASARLARELGIEEDVLRQTVDDASFLVDELVDESAAPSPYVLVSLSTHLGGRPREASVAAIAALLDRLAATTGAPVRFHAHWGSLRAGEVRGDSVLHEEVRRAMQSPSEVLPTGDSPDAARLARGAALLVTSRYHPAVFAVPAGVPTLGVCVDQYTRVKLTGALGNFDQSGVVTIDEVVDGSAVGRAEGLWDSRESIRSRGIAAANRRRAESDAWWDELYEMLRG